MKDRKLPNESAIMERWKYQQDEIKVSIVCHTFNQEKFVEDALFGFLTQETDFPFEILVHDDASSDRTQSIINKYRCEYPNIIRVIFQKENKYSQGFRIISITLPQCKGSYIAFCEGDDYWCDPHKLKKQVDFLEVNPDYVITYHDCQAFDESGIVDIDFGGARKDLSSDELKKSPSIFTLTTCFRNVIQGFPPEMQAARYGDLFLWSLLGHWGRGKYLDTIQAARYRVHAGGVFSLQAKRKKQEMRVVTFAALLSYYARIGEEELAKHHLSEVMKSSLRCKGFKETVLILFSTLWRKIRLNII